MTPVDWALQQNVSATKKLLLVGIAWLGDDDGVTMKGQKTIAARLGQDERWVREHVKGLASEGLVSRFRRHRMNGSRTSDLTVLNLPRDEPLDLSNYSGIVGDLEPGDVVPTGGNPPGGLPAEIGDTYRRESAEPTGGNPPPHPDNRRDQPGGLSSSDGRKGAREVVDEFPDDLPAALHDAAMAAGKILKRTALERGQRKEVTRGAVGHAVLTFPDRDHVKVAREVEAWLLHGKGARKSCADVVARYRNFLDNSDPPPAPPLPGAPNGLRPTSGDSGNISAMRDMAATLRERGQ